MAGFDQASPRSASGRPFVCAHRGFPEEPGEENTLKAFQRAIALGCDLVELDVRCTRDGQLVVFHDDCLSKSRISELDRAGLDRLAAVAGMEIPSLEESFRIMAGRVRLDIEIKRAGFEVPLVELARRLLPPNGYFFSSFHFGVLRSIHAIAPEEPLGWIIGRQNFAAFLRRRRELLAPAGVDRSLPVRFLVPHRFFLSPRMLSQCAKAGVGVIPWTVNEPAEMVRLAKAGAWGLITDRPDLAMWELRQEPRA